MATYVPNATQTTEPVESQTVESAALEFRTLKARVNALAASVTADDLTDLRVPETSIAVLPPVAARAGKVLGFDAGGDPTLVEVAGATDPSLRSDLAASSGASLVGYLPTGTGAVATTVQSKLRESVSVKDFGAVGDGSDESSKFITFESSTKGAAVDLLGLTCVVTTIPNGNDYFNGSWKVGASVYALNRNPREHPLANPSLHAKTLLANEGKYRGLSTAAFHKPGSANLAIVYRESLGHGVEDNAPIYCAISDDMGDRFGLSTSNGITTKVIAQQSNADIRNWASGVMGSGRFGILASRRDIGAGSIYLQPLFLYSDDAGATWSQSSVSFTSASWDSHSRIYPHPASVGGHDTLGWIVYAYTTSHGICAMKTVNNGATWTEVLNCVLPTSLDGASEAASLSEMSVARVGNENKWVMVVRTNQEAAVSTSTNMTTWTSAKLIQTTTQDKLLANPPELTYEDGKFWFWTFSRRGSKEIYPEYANALMVSEGDPAAVYASGGATGWQQWRVVSSLPFWPSGYMNLFKVRNRQYALCTTAEDTAGSQTSRQCALTLLGPDPTVTPSIRGVFNMLPKPNLYPVGDWRHFPLGDTHVSGASRVSVTPLMSLGRVGGVTGATISRLSGSNSQYKLRIRRDDGNASAALINTIIVFPKEDCIHLRNRYITISFDAIAASGFSSASSFLTVRARSTADSGEGVVTSNSGTFPVGDTTVQSANTGITLTQNLQRYECVIGPFAADINQMMVQLNWSPVGTALDDFIEIENLKIEDGKVATPFEIRPLAEVKAWADRFVRVLNMVTANGVVVRNFDPPMHRVPTVTLSRGTAGAPTVDYVSVTDVAASVATLTAIAKM